MNRLDNSIQRLLRINRGIHGVVALAFICLGNDISPNGLAFAGQFAGAADRISKPPLGPSHPSPRRLMKKTSAAVEKVARPIRRDLAVSLFAS